MRQVLSIWCVTGVIAVTGALVPALATSEYVYKPGEFVVIDDGRAPNRQFALAAHGSGDYGGIGFRVYLMAEPAHEKARGATVDRRRRDPRHGAKRLPCRLVAGLAPCRRAFSQQPPRGDHAA